ncbi:hypothetical protein HPB50_014121 [Hyalomma asiaticum]|uniref:Uncharacterized protein n=1 Tax=Hyalomma asiaticum TaxID=266040 RepID=A0ACB7S546_HYAAI|nr:hypothetical protein HPB50_014121 [Hyalomma asiaticum]
MNVLHAVQIFSPQVTAALCHLQENRCGDPALYSFREVSPTVLFMKMMKQWFDVHDTVYNGSDNKKPISDENDHRLLWLEKDFTCYVRNIQEASIASRKGEFTDETYQALLFTTKATVETTRFLLGRGMKYVLTRNFNSDPVEALFRRPMCGGNDVLDARAVTIALDNIVKGKAVPLKEMQEADTHAEELATAVPQEVIAQLENFKGHFLNPSPSVTYSGLVYVGGYLVKLISEEKPCLTVEDIKSIFASSETSEAKIGNLTAKLDGLIKTDLWECEDIFPQAEDDPAIIDCIIYFVAGYVARKFRQKSDCETCRDALGSTSH